MVSVTLLKFYVSLSCFLAWKTVVLIWPGMFQEIVSVQELSATLCLSAYQKSICHWALKDIGWHSWTDLVEIVTSKHWRKKKKKKKIRKRKKLTKEKNRKLMYPVEKALGILCNAASYSERRRNRNIIRNKHHERPRLLVPKTVVCCWFVESLVFLISDLLM